MNDAELNAIRTRDAAATPGPWFSGPMGGYEAIAHSALERGVGYEDVLCNENRVANGVFCAHARSDIPALLAEVARLRRLLAVDVAPTEPRGTG